MFGMVVEWSAPRRGQTFFCAYLHVLEGCQSRHWGSEVLRRTENITRRSGVRNQPRVRRLRKAHRPSMMTSLEHPAHYPTEHASTRSHLAKSPSAHATVKNHSGGLLTMTDTQVDSGEVTSSSTPSGCCQKAVKGWHAIREPPGSQQMEIVRHCEDGQRLETSRASQD